MGWSCDPWRFSFSKMAAAELWDITVEEIELLSFLRQNIVRRICVEAERQGLSKRDMRVVQAVVAYFNWGPAPHHIFNHLVWHLAHTIWRWAVHVTPQVTGKPVLAWNSIKNLVIDCPRQLKASVSINFWALSAIFFSKREIPVTWPPHGGRDAGWNQQNSNIVLFYIWIVSN